MYMNKVFGFLAILILSACAGDTTPRTDWYGEYNALETGTPVALQYGSPDMQPGTPTDNLVGAPVHRMAVMLPLSGDAANTGRAIRNAIEIATLQSAPQNLSVAFYDTARDTSVAISDALATNPEIIIGPVFADNVRALRDAKPENIPVLSFTSDATALGDGVMTMALLPINSTEAIVREMSSDNVTGFIILAPDTESGHLMAGAAQSAAGIYNIPITGVFYYSENNTESIKSTTLAASMNTARTAANTRAREILSDILTNERLTILEESALNIQLERMSKMDVIGQLPYDAVLFLGNGDDTETLASFMRYYGVSTRDARFYGTALWDGSDITSDITMIGAKYATLPEMTPSFVNLYERVTGALPDRMAGFGYDAANMAMGMIYSHKSDAAYLLDPSGYAGASGLYRLEPGGENERALQIMQIAGDGNAHIVRGAATNFITPIYSLEQGKIKPADAMELETPGVNPDDYISIPVRLTEKYESETYGTHLTAPTPAPHAFETITILPEDDRDIVITSPDFKPVTLESINRTYIDEIEIEE